MIISDLCNYVNLTYYYMADTYINNDLIHSNFMNIIPKYYPYILSYVIKEFLFKLLIISYCL